MSIRVEVWIDCDKCDNDLGPNLTETTARNVAKALRWMPFRHLRDGREVDVWWCPDCVKAMPAT